MLTKQEKFIHEYFPNSNSFTIHRDCFVFEDGVHIASGRHSMGFTCDMLEEMKAYIGDDQHDAVKAASVMWTESAIDAFHEQQMRNVVTALKDRWPALSDDKSLWDNEQIQAFNDYLDVKFHLPLK
jgi:hypothetical protein